MLSIPSFFYEPRQWSLSPYINRFLSADTIVPNPSNPQSWNRFSYVLNNPLRYTDPTGHRECEDEQGICLSVKQVTKRDKIQKQKRSKFLAELRELLESGPSGPACSGSNQSVICLPAAETGQHIPADLRLQYTQFNSPSFSYDFDALANGLGVELMAYDLVMTMQNAADYTKPAYRQLKALVPLTPLEMGISASLQSIGDLDNELNPIQRISRSGIVAIETGITDLISDGYGAAGYVQAGVYGYGIAASAANLAMDTTWDNLNSRVFPIFNLGGYP